MKVTVAVQVNGAPVRLLRGMVEDTWLFWAQKAVARVVVTLMGGLWVAWVAGTLTRGPIWCYVMKVLSTKSALGMSGRLQAHLHWLGTAGGAAVVVVGGGRAEGRPGRKRSCGTFSIGPELVEVASACHKSSSESCTTTPRSSKSAQTPQSKRSPMPSRQ